MDRPKGLGKWGKRVHNETPTIVTSRIKKKDGEKLNKEAVETWIMGGNDNHSKRRVGQACDERRPGRTQRGGLDRPGRKGKPIDRGKGATPSTTKKHVQNCGCKSGPGIGSMKGY